jgi:putative hydrolase of HD superfamily
MPKNIQDLETVFRDFLNLKKLRRTGWQLRGIRDGESLADHCFGVVFLTFILGQELQYPDLDREKATQMAIIHEIAECRVGDIPFPALEFLTGKSAAEQKATRAIFSPLKVSGDALQALFEEFEAGISCEAKFVRAIDKLDMLITALEYEHSGFTALGDFWENTITFKTFEPFPELAAYAASLRDRHFAGNPVGSAAWNRTPSHGFGDR